MALAARHIVVTRPEGQAIGICEALRHEGAVPVSFPLLGISPVADNKHLRAVIARLDEFDLAFFVSPNAVRYAVDAVQSIRSWPSSVQVATVGVGSENALRQRGFDNVIAPSSGFDSESVIALPAFSAEAVKGKRVVIFRGDGGRELLGQHLLAHGATVEHVGVYHRYCPQKNARPLSELASKGQLDAILLTSSEGVRYLASLLLAESDSGVRLTPVFAPHPRIAAFCREEGFENVILTNPGDDGLLAGLKQFYA